jgi:2-methylisocitrate lyase-like PEP mutase family enzyme
MSPAPSQAERGATFVALHEGDPFVIPNPWDAGSAKVLEALGFPALTTTSSGLRLQPRAARRRDDPR